MADKYNKKLYALMNASALVECVIPVIVCDENFRVCMISHGARGSFRPISCGRDMSKLFTPSNIEKMNTLDGATVFKMARGEKSINVIVLGGELEGERYLMIIAEPQIMFFSEPAPWYIDEAFDAVRSAATRLLSCEKVGTRHLEWSAAMLARLSEFVDNNSDTAYSLTHSGDIYSEIDIVMKESTDALKAIGVSVSYDKKLELPFCTRVTPKHVYLVATTLVTALSLISADGNIHVECENSTREAADYGEFMEISFCVTPDAELCALTDFGELISSVPHLSLELAAVSDMASRTGLLLECTGSDGALTVCMRIPPDENGTVKFRGADLVAKDAVRARMLSLCEHINRAR